MIFEYLCKSQKVYLSIKSVIVFELELTMIDFPLFWYEHTERFRSRSLSIFLSGTDPEQFIFGTLSHFQILFMYSFRHFDSL